MDQDKIVIRASLMAANMQGGRLMPHRRSFPRYLGGCGSAWWVFLATILLCAHPTLKASGERRQAHTCSRGLLLFTADIEAANWARIARDSGLTTIGVHPGGGHLKPTMIPDTMAWVQSPRGKAFLRECRRLGIDVEYEVHALRELLPRNLFAEHPEYFRVGSDGKRTSDLNLCFHSREALDIVADNAIAFARVCRPTTSRYYFWLDDRRDGFCSCERCAVFRPSEQALIFENHLLHRLREFDPKATLAHLAYQNTIEPPRAGMVKPDPGVFLEFAPNRNYRRPYHEQWGKGGGPQLLMDNLKIFPRKTAKVLEYWMDISRFSEWKRPFVELPWRQAGINADMAYLQALGIRHVTSFGNGADAEYIRRFGMPPVDRYGDCISKHISAAAHLDVPALASHSVRVDGILDEALYDSFRPYTTFLVAGERGRPAPLTEAWAFWSREQLVVAFRCRDETAIAQPPSRNERDVDRQDRAEVFLWSGKDTDPYYCIEMAREGAVHEYRARFYRRFDDGWAPAGWEHRAAATSDGYAVEASLCRQAMESMGLSLRSGQSFQIGFFRADFRKDGGDPTWITWRERIGEPDFHVAESFDSAVLQGRG